MLSSFYVLLHRTGTVVAVVAFSGLLLYAFTDSRSFFRLSRTFSSSSSLFNHSSALISLKEPQKLEKILKNAATKDNTVIITTLNEAWAAPNSLLDLFLASFRLGNGTEKLLNHLVIIALDQKAYERCLVVHKHCFTLVTDGVDFHQEAGFMTPIYLTMMWRRTEFLRYVLNMGYNFVFTDTDIMWFRDPFALFYSDADFQIACDQYEGNPDDMNNRPNGGYIYVKSNNRSREFYKFWIASRETYPGTNEQDVFNIIKFDPYILKIGLKVKFLDTAYFGGFCAPSRDLNLVCTMHANCCFGLDNKLYDLRLMLQDWRAFMSLPQDLKHECIVSWRVPKKCKYSKPPKKL